MNYFQSADKKNSITFHIKSRFAKFTQELFGRFRLRRTGLSAVFSCGRMPLRSLTGRGNSAFVNLTRLIRAQAENAPQIFYDQDEWVRLQRYNSCDTEALLRLWYS